MRDAETILAIIRERGSRGLPLKDAYRQLFQPALYLRAYARISGNPGAMTPGTTTETADGMSRAKIEAIINAVHDERYRWTPARRTYIPKPNGKRRPLGIPTWSDKLLQEVIRSILEAYYEPQFSDLSHGFRPGRGCHTALTEIRREWTGTTWFIEGDISQCFDRLDHTVLLAILRERIHDNRFVRLIGNLLKAGYLEDWTYHATLSGTPQGGVVSPILANIYLDRLDTFVETVLLPAHNRGTTRKGNVAYRRLSEQSQYWAKKGRKDRAHTLRRQMQRLPSQDPTDPDYRRLRYLRYADDFVLGFIGPRDEAEGIKLALTEFLRDSLKLELSQAKTLITHARTEDARFLGYAISVMQSDQKRDRRGHRCINGGISLKVPVDVVRAKVVPYLQAGKPMARTERTHNSPYSVVAQFQQEYRGLVEYYQLAQNLHQFNRLRWVMELSLAKTLAVKLRISVAQVFRRFKTTIQTERGPRKVLQVTAERGNGKAPLVTHWGGISLARRRDAILNDQPPAIWNGRTEVVQRLLADNCELCGSRLSVQVHHIRALADLTRRGQGEPPEWVKVMAARRRKTLVVCHRCHVDIHAGRPTQQRITECDTGEPDDTKGSHPVRRGADRKVSARGG